MANPFHPSFGVSPPLLVGRDGLIEAIAEAIEDGPGAPARATLYTGPRGSGKTVLLNAIEDKAREMRWHVISETASAGFVPRIAHQHLPAILRNLDPGAVRRHLSGFNLPLGPLGSAGANWDTIEAHIAEAGLRNQIDLLTGLLAEADSGLVITLDEVHQQQIQELRELATTVQHGFREGQELIFVGAGLSSAVSDVMNDEVLTFLRRADRHHLGPVGHGDVKRAIRWPIESFGRSISEEALSIMANGTGGYPFLIQLVGYRTWRRHPDQEEISIEDASEGVLEARRRLGSLVYEPALTNASDIDRTFLLAMAKDDGPSKMADIQKRLGVDENYISQYRLRLIAAELIERKKHGYVDFALPYMREYLRDEAAAEV